MLKQLWKNFCGYETPMTVHEEKMSKDIEIWRSNYIRAFSPEKGKYDFFEKVTYNDCLNYLSENVDNSISISSYNFQTSRSRTFSTKDGLDAYLKQHVGQQIHDLSSRIASSTDGKNSKLPYWADRRDFCDNARKILCDGNCEQIFDLLYQINKFISTTNVVQKA